MRQAIMGALLAAAVAMTPAMAQQAGGLQLPAPREENVEDLPAGPGREETFGLCAACHAYRIVSNQGLSRERWDETLTWMTERHNMPPLEGDERKLILDYLATAHPPKQSPGGFKNPFLE